jgi:aryl-alcohol dehydrogenase-like predicted oxidoreductase
MKYRTLGKTGLKVSEIGQGAGGKIGFPDFPDQEAQKQFNLALDLGINFIDTGSNYSMGNSEKRIGQFLKQRRQEFILATKCGSFVVEENGAGVDVKRDFSYKGIIQSVEDSLRRLQSDYVDIIQFHTAPAKILEQGHEAIEALLAVQKAGKARFIGLSAGCENALKAIDLGVFDTLQITYNVVQQEADEVIHKAARSGLGVIIKEPLANCFFINREKPSEDYAYQIPTWEKAERFAFLAEYGKEKAVQNALRFVLDHPGVSVAIPSMARADHLRVNLGVSEMVGLDKDINEKILKS